MSQKQQQLWNNPVDGSSSNHLWDASDSDGYVHTWRKAIWERICTVVNGRTSPGISGQLFSTLAPEIFPLTLVTSQNSSFKMPDISQTWNDPYDCYYAYKLAPNVFTGFNTRIDLVQFLMRIYPVEVSILDPDFDPGMFFPLQPNSPYIGPLGTFVGGNLILCSQKYYDKQKSKYGSCALTVSDTCTARFIYKEGVSDPNTKNLTGRIYELSFSKRKYTPIYYMWEAPSTVAYPVKLKGDWICISPFTTTRCTDGVTISSSIQGFNNGVVPDISAGIGFGPPQRGDYVLHWWKAMGWIVSQLQTNFIKFTKKSTGAIITDVDSTIPSNSDWVYQPHTVSIRHRWPREILLDDITYQDSQNKSGLAWLNPQIGWRARVSRDISFGWGGTAAQFMKKRFLSTYQYIQGPIAQRFFLTTRIFQKAWIPVIGDPDLIEDNMGDPVYGSQITAKTDYPVTGDYFGSWILEDLRTALKQLKFTPEVPDYIGTTTIKINFADPKWSQPAGNQNFDPQTYQFSFDSRQYSVGSIKTDAYRFLSSANLLTNTPGLDLVPGSQWFGQVSSSVTGLNSNHPDWTPIEVWIGSTGQFIIGRQSYVPVNGKPHIFARFIYTPNNATNINGRQYGSMQSLASPTVGQSVSYYEIANDKTYNFNLFNNFPSINDDGMSQSGNSVIGNTGLIPHVNEFLSSSAQYKFGTLALMEWDFEFK